MRAALAALPWMRDGVSGEEEDAATTVRYAAEVALESGFTDLLVTLTERAWVRDGLAPVEISALFSLVSLAHRAADAAGLLLGMSSHPSRRATSGCCRTSSSSRR